MKFFRRMSFDRKAKLPRKKGLKAGCGRGSNSVHGRLSVEKGAKMSPLVGVDPPLLKLWRGRQHGMWVARRLGAQMNA